MMTEFSKFKKEMLPDAKNIYKRKTTLYVTKRHEMTLHHYYAYSVLTSCVAGDLIRGSGVWGGTARCAEFHRQVHCPVQTAQLGRVQGWGWTEQGRAPYSMYSGSHILLDETAASQSHGLAQDPYTHPDRTWNTTREYLRRWRRK